MQKIILLTLVFIFASTSQAQEQYIKLDRYHATLTLKRTASKDKRKTAIKQTDSTIVCVTIDTLSRGFITMLYLDKYGICNKVVEIYQIDSCYHAAFNNVLNETRFEWTPIMPGTYLSKFSKRLLLFKNPNLPSSYILQHNKFMTHKQYDDFIIKIK